MNFSAHFKVGLVALGVLCAVMAWAPFADAAPKTDPPGSIGKSDLNRDGVVDYDDLVIFSSNYLGQSAESVAWCELYLEQKSDGNP